MSFRNYFHLARKSVFPSRRLDEFRDLVEGVADDIEDSASPL